MDTRAKIRSTRFGLCAKNARIVTGAFDPLLAEHARSLENLSQPDQTLIVVIVDPPNPLLPQQARAELVAALACVDYVIVDTGIDDAAHTHAFLEQVVCKSRES